MTRKRKTNRAHPLMIFWSKAEANRFSETAEKFVRLVNDLETLVEGMKRRRPMKAPTAPPPQEEVPA